MEDCSVATDAGIIDRCAGIDVRPTIEEERGCREVAVFRGHMQERSSLKQEIAPTGLAAIEFGKTLITEWGIGVNQLSQTIKPAAEQLQHRGLVVPGLATRIEKDVNAGAQPLGGTRVRCEEVVQSRAWIWMAAYLVPMVATVRICAVIEKPFKSGRTQ